MAISALPELVKLAEEVKETHTPRVLRRDNEDIAVLMPVAARKRYKGRTKTKEDYEATLHAAGGWKGLVDTEKLKMDM
jgi:hypothetical protein